LILLGSTGSIGQNALAIAQRYDLNVEVLVAGTRIDILNAQIAQFHPKQVVIANASDIHKVNHPHVRAGSAAIIDTIEHSGSSLVVNAMVGFAGLAPTMAAINAGKKVALANKESLVVGGAFVNTSRIVPIDSEHFGLWYLQNGRAIRRMIITASGGAFRDWPLEAMVNATLADTQKHPNWSMGQKITIDSATMMNKLFELLEARWLFGEGEYDALIERKSLVHALVDFVDGSMTAHLAHANMQLPIAYALRGRVDEPLLPAMDLVAMGALEFAPIDVARYPLWELKEDVLRHPHKGVVLNAANEAAIKRFIAGEIGFMDMANKVKIAYERFDARPRSIDEVYAWHEEVYQTVLTL